VTIQTVLGPIEPDALGITLPHEHLLTSLAPRFVEPADEVGRRLAREPVTLRNLSWVRRNYLSSLDNLTLGPESLAIEEVAQFRAAGGGTIVDASSIGLRGDLAAIARIATATGVNVVVATGYYTYDFHAPSMAAATPEQLAEVIARELTDGINGTGVRAGIIGEVGCNWPLRPDERKSVVAAGFAQAATGAPVSIHPGRSPRSPFEILEILVSAGADPGRVVMGHIERTELSREDLLALARTGVYLEYDWFGETLSMHPTGPVNVPSDTERIDQIQLLFAQGHGRQVLASHDVCLKTRLAAYGGMGYGHIPGNVAGWMRAKGMSDADVTAVLIDNPRRMLSGETV
jgi:phosphotriesterase-related protein